MADCANCGGCSGDCAGCGGCAARAGELVLTAGEIEFLRLLGQVAFLPVARKMGEDRPVYLEDDRFTPDEYSLLLQTMEKKNLISLDYSIPLAGADQQAYADYPIRGSIALTRRGQLVLELLDIQGVE